MASSDYGSDLDADSEEIVDSLLSAVEINPIASQNLAVESLVEDEDVRARRVARVRRPPQDGAGSAQFELRSQTHDKSSRSGRIYGDRISLPGEVSAAHESSVVDNWEAVATFPRRTSDARAGKAMMEAQDVSAGQVEEGQDTGSPLERFRTKPKKPLSVTDIVSPAWCELQYSYTLTKFGKKKQTPAMKQGSAVHRALEEQVHTIVQVDVQTREDSWALRIWNVIQGLRTLRTSGLTRELEIWGVIDGQVVNGVIDEVSYECPDPTLEADLETKKASASGRKAVAADQKTLDQFLPQQTSHGSLLPSQPDPQARRKLYLTDVKTRSRPSLPSQAAMRPTIMQLMLYRSLFLALAANTVPAQAIFDRYSLDAQISFTDSFVSEIGGLDGSGSTEGSALGERSGVHELQNHNSLTLLWQLMMQEFAQTVSSPNSVGEILCARFVSANDEGVLGSRCFAFDSVQLERYVNSEMEWWRGERPAKGVEVEEAYKCQICEFADECTWRKEKIDEAINRHRQRRGRVVTA